MKNFARFAGVFALGLAFVGDFIARPSQAQTTVGSLTSQMRPVPRPVVPFPLRPPVVGYLVVPSYGGYPYSPYYSPYYPYYSPYYYGPDYGNPYGSIMAPNSMYGPVGMRNFLGLDQPTQPAQLRGNSPRRAIEADNTPRPKVRETSVEAKIVAGKSLDAGDALFGKQKYSSALDRYKRAVQTAPDMAESYYREGHAMVALAQYTSAGKAFRKGLEIGPEWLESGFKLDQIYGDNRVAKSSHFEALALAAEKNPKDANLLVVLGVELFFDGQADRARKFFERSVALGGNRDHLLDPFLIKGKAAAKANGKQTDRVEF